MCCMEPLPSIQLELDAVDAWHDLEIDEPDFPRRFPIALQPLPEPELRTTRDNSSLARRLRRQWALRPRRGRSQPLERRVGRVPDDCHESPQTMGLFARIGDLMVVAILLTVAIPLVCVSVCTFFIALSYFIITAMTVFGSMAVREILAPRKDPPPTAAARTRPISIVSNSPTTPSQRPMRSDSMASLASTTTGRDYEGVGGWRPVADDDEDQTLFLEMNSRLQHPSPNRRRRSVTSSSVRSSMLNSPELVGTPLYMRNGLGSARHRRRPSGPLTPGSVSPQNYFNLPISSSMTAINNARTPGGRTVRGDESISVASDDETAVT